MAIFNAFSSIFIISVLLKGAEAHLWQQPAIPENRTDVLNEWMTIDGKLKDFTRKSLIKFLMPKLLDGYSEMNITAQCVRQSFQIISGLKNLEKWAFQFVDSSAKMVDGTMAGTFTFLGVYDECLDIVVPDPIDDVIRYRGQYCTAEIRLPLPHKKRTYRLYDQLEALNNFTGSETLEFLASKAHIFYFLPYKLGLCVPSGCSKNDLNQLLHYAAKKLELDVDVTHCEVKESKKFFKVHILAIVFTCILGSLVLLGTYLEVYSKRKNIPNKTLTYKLLLCFSLINNFKRLSSTKSSAENLRCLHGFRFLSMMWVVVGHCYFYPTWFIRSYRNLFYVEEMAGEPVAQILTNGSEAVDSFIFMSGLLLNYLAVKYVIIDKNKFDVKLFIFHRLWRIIPVYYFIILFGMLAPLMGSGPLFHETMQESVYPCYQYWWRNLLFINNFFYQGDSCWMHTWYVACSIQLHLLSLLILLPMFKSEKIGLTINISIIVISILYNGIITYIKDLFPTTVITHIEPEDRSLGFLFTYSNALSRAGPYFIGTLVGYILAKKPSVKIPKPVQVIGWCLSILSSGFVIFGSALWFGGEGPLPLDVLMYATFYKVAFTFGIAWMLFCCITGNAGKINSFLSWKTWIPLGKLTFLIYLIQPIFQTLYIANFHSTQEFTHLQAIVRFFGFFCISSLLALICNLLVESPFLSIEKLMLPTKELRAKTTQEIAGDTKNALSNDGEIYTYNEKTDAKVANGVSSHFVDVSRL